MLRADKPVSRRNCRGALKETRHPPMFRLLRERPEDSYEVEMLYDLAFAPGRTALTSYKLREGILPIETLSSMARDEYDTLAGAIRYWPFRIGGDESTPGAPALLLGPIAVHPTHQGEGLGALLMAQTMDRAAELGWKRIVLVGDEPYYAQFGFSARLGSRMNFPPPTNPARVLAKSLALGAWKGVSGDVKKGTA